MSPDDNPSDQEGAGSDSGDESQTGEGGSGEPESDPWDTPASDMGLTTHGDESATEERKD